MSIARGAAARRMAVLIVACLATFAPATFGMQVAADRQYAPGYKPAAYAIKGVKVVTRPGSTIDEGTVLVRDGVIEAVGPVDEVTIPADAEVIEGDGLVVYPGFIDLYTTLGALPAEERGGVGAGREVAFEDYALPSTPPDNRNGLTPEYEVASRLKLDDDAMEARRKQGFTAVLAAPGGSIATGQSALVTTTGLPRRESILASPTALHIAVKPPSEAAGNGEGGGNRGGGAFAGYPTSLMGAVAHLRQAMLDSDYDGASRKYYRDHGGPRPASDPCLEALAEARYKVFPTWWEADSRDEIHRALDLASEFGTTATIVGGREADRVLDRLKTGKIAVVLRVNYPDEPKVPSEEKYRETDILERADPLRILENRKAKWDERVEAPAKLADGDVPFAFSSDGLDSVDKFHAQVRKAIEHGLEADRAVAALTSKAAEIAGLSDRLGTIEPGKLGHLTILSAPYGDKKAKVRYVFADGLKFDYTEKPKDKAKDKDEDKDKDDEAENDEESKGDKPDADEAKSKPDDDPDKEAGDEGETEPKPETEDRPDDPKPDELSQEDKPPETPFVDVASELDEDREPSIHTGGNVLIKDAKILTVGPAGTIEKGSILVKDGKIAAIGADVEAPDGVIVIDGAGLVAMPGIIDTHSHMAISGGVNEMSLSIVPEVRVADVVDGDDGTIYRALAGGTTAARLLHGSANAIGGQDAIIKLKPGLPARELILKDDRRPQGVKFALGENVTRRPDRFPNTRMGVEATIERAFLEGRAYAERRKEYEEAEAEEEPMPPFRRDLRLEALARILDGSIKIHSHCYRSDEILMLLRLAERFGVRVQSLQHVLEGYKVAAEIAEHGASASTFSDWWAYKIEAYDAIPYNAALLTEAGARVCIKSDSEELVRHLYLEAAKMVRYGSVPEAKALEMITLNPALELGLDHRMGSLEVGKDADIALFNAHPFDSFARCELALIDGEVRFQRDKKAESFDTRPGPDAFPPSEVKETADIDPADFDAVGAFAIVGATVHPVSCPAIEDGVVVVRDGKIEAVGGPDTEVPDGVMSIRADGLDLWPGMIDAGSLIGLFEIGSLSETQDFSESARFEPELKSSTALHPDSEVIPVMRANGILSAYVQPTGGTISGRGCVIDLDGWVPSEMVVEDVAALNVNIPRYFPPSPDGGRFAARGRELNKQREERLEGIRAQFKAALKYDEIRSAAEDGKVDAPAPDPRLEALVPFAKGEKPVIFQVERAREILDALALADELKLKAVLNGAAEAWKVVDEIKKADVPVIVAGTLRLPLDATDPYASVYENPGKLHEAGIRFAIRSVGEGPDQASAGRNLPFEAATAAAYGLPDDEALRAVTLYPAQILGVADRLGTIEPGKRANLVLTAGHVLQATSDVRALVIGGRMLPPESRHTRLYEKYRGRLHAVQTGKAPLGLVRDGDHPKPGRAAATNSEAGGNSGRR